MILIYIPVSEAPPSMLQAHSVPMLPFHPHPDKHEPVQGTKYAPSTGNDIIGMCHAARQQNGIYLTVQHNGSRTDAFGYLVNHGIQYQPGMLVPFLYPADNGRHIGRAQMGCQPGTAGDTLFKFVFCVATGQQRSINCPAGSVPARSGENGPSPSSALFTSTALP